MRAADLWLILLLLFQENSEVVEQVRLLRGCSDGSEVELLSTVIVAHVLLEEHGERQERITVVLLHRQGLLEHFPSILHSVLLLRQELSEGDEVRRVVGLSLYCLGQLLLS